MQKYVAHTLANLSFHGKRNGSRTVVAKDGAVKFITAGRVQHLNFMLLNKLKLMQSVKSHDGITMDGSVNPDDASGFYARFFLYTYPRMQWKPGIFFLNPNEDGHFPRRTEITTNTSVLEFSPSCRSTYEFYSSRNCWHPIIDKKKWYNITFIFYS